MALWLQWLICGLAALGAAVYLALQWGLIPQRKRKQACGCAKCPMAQATLANIEQAAPAPRRRSMP